MALALPRDFESADALQILEQARPILDLTPDAQLHVENVTRTARGTRIDFSYTQRVVLDDNTLCDVAGICVDLRAQGELKFNARGELVQAHVEPADPRQLRAIADHVSKLVANGEVYVPKPGEQIDTEQLRRQGKAWYVEQDAHGYKHLKRAWIS